MKKLLLLTTLLCLVSTPYGFTLNKNMYRPMMGTSSIDANQKTDAMAGLNHFSSELKTYKGEYTWGSIKGVAKYQYLDKEGGGRNDYKVSMQIWDQYLFNNTGNEKDAFVSISVQGKDVAPNGETILSYSLKGHQLVKDSSVKIQWMINNQQIFNKYFVAKGDEYDKYIIAKKQ